MLGVVARDIAEPVYAVGELGSVFRQVKWIDGPPVSSYYVYLPAGLTSVTTSSMAGASRAGWRTGIYPVLPRGLHS
jgi:hypothetical protein